MGFLWSGAFGDTPSLLDEETWVGESLVGESLVGPAEGGGFCSLLGCRCGDRSDRPDDDSMESLDCGDSRVGESTIFSLSSLSLSPGFDRRSFRLNNPLSIPFFSFFRLSSLGLSGS